MDDNPKAGTADRDPGRSRLSQDISAAAMGEFFAAAAALLVMKSVQAKIQVAFLPLSNGHCRQIHPLGDGGVGFIGTAGQHDLGALED